MSRLMYCFVLFQGDYVVEKIEPLVTPEDFDEIVKPMFLEYFDHGSTQEVVVGLHYYPNVKTILKSFFLYFQTPQIRSRT